MADGYCSPISAPSGLSRETGESACSFAAARLAYYNGNRVLFYHVE